MLDQRERNRTYYAENRAEIREQQRWYHRTHPERFWAARHRQRARQYGLDLVTHLVTRQQLIAQWGDCCVYCGGDFEVTDHVIPVAAGGHHTIENVVPCCCICNGTKRTADLKLIRAFRAGSPGTQLDRDPCT